MQINVSSSGISKEWLQFVSSGEYLRLIKEAATKAIVKMVCLKYKFSIGALVKFSIK